MKYRGFTLIELLIVIAVIAILVGIAVPRFLGMRDEANFAVANGEVAALRAAVEAYRIHNDAFPVEGATWQSVLVNTRPQLIESALTDPFDSAAQYGLEVSANGRYYVIFSKGPDALADVTGVCDTGEVTPASVDDDIFITNGPGTTIAACP